MDGTASPVAEAPVSTTSWLRIEPYSGDQNDRPNRPGMVMFSFVVVGSPKPKARPRFRRTPNFVQTYTPETTVNWEQTIVAQVKAALVEVNMTYPGEADVLPLAGRIMADIRINCLRAKSLPKSVQFPMKATPGDVDNLAKSVLDALQLAGVIQDDKTVTDLSAYKRFADTDHPEGIEVQLTGYFGE